VRPSAVAATAGRWASRDDVPETLQHLARILLDLAEHASGTACPAAETLDAIRVIGCHLCKRLGQAGCVSPSTAGVCPLGWPSAA
jgi:hypothetical protein